MSLNDKNFPAPLVIETAISPFRPGAPAFNHEEIVREAKECLEAGASIIHYHYDS